MSMDTALRAITDDGAFRVITIRSTETVRGAIAAQGVEKEVARVLADLLTGSILVRESMAPDLRVQLILQPDAKMRLVADSHPEGIARGLVQMAQGANLRFGGKSVLQVARTLHNGALQQGVVQVTEEGSVSTALMRYMALSEQVVSMIAVGCHADAQGQVLEAGGYLVQLLPEVVTGPLMVMTERLKDFEDIVPLLAAGKADPATLLGELLYGMPYTVVGEDKVAFGCTCDETRLAATLASLPREEIESMIADGRVIDASCDYCSKTYQFAPERLRGLLARS
jgi:molecular chaperone Hsp33